MLLHALAVAVTLFYVVAVVPGSPHVEAWALHAGCIVVLAAVWWIALSPRRAVAGLIVAFVGAGVIGLGILEIGRAERRLSDELTSLARQRLTLPDPAPAPEELVAIACDRRRGWGRAALLSLALLRDPHADFFSNAGEWPSASHRDHRALLWMDRIGLLKSGLAAEQECRRSAEKARMLLLAR